MLFLPSLVLPILISTTTIVSKTHSSLIKRDSPTPINLDLELKSDTKTRNAAQSTDIFKRILLRDVQRGQRSIRRSDDDGKGPDLDPLSSQAIDRAVGPTVDIENDVISYQAKVKVGSSNQTFNLIIDTGSSNTWIGAEQKFGLSNSTSLTNSSFEVSYGSGAVEGDEIIETIGFGEELSFRQSIGVARRAQGFQSVDGILGVGPTRLTLGTQTSRATEVPTIIETLYAQGKIPNQILGVSFAPSKVNKSLNGRMTLGGVDPDLFEGDMTWIPRTLTRPSAFYWGVNVTMTCGRIVVVPNSAGIMDTGTTLILITDAGLKNYVDAIPGAILEPETATGLVKIPADQIATIPPFVFDFGTFKATLSSEQQLFPVEISKDFGGEPGFRYSVINTLGTIQGLGGLDFIIGQKFLEYFYTAYDGNNNAVGIAPSSVIG